MPAVPGSPAVYYHGGAVLSSDGTRLFVTGFYIGTGPKPGIGTIAFNTATGAELWRQSYSGPSDNSYERPEQIVTSADGKRVYVVGYTHGEDGILLEYVTIAYDAATGTELWNTRYAGLGKGSLPWGIIVSPDGRRVFVTGRSFGSDSKVDYATVAYDANSGQQLWEARYDDGAYAGASVIDVSPDGSSVFVSGVLQTDGNAVQSITGNPVVGFATLAYDAATGTQLWSRKYQDPFPANADVNALKVSPTGDAIYITGVGNPLLPQFGENLHDGLTFAYNAKTGDLIWQSRYTVPGRTQQFNDLSVSADGKRVFMRSAPQQMIRSPPASTRLPSRTTRRMVPSSGWGGIIAVRSLRIRILPTVAPSAPMDHASIRLPRSSTV